MSKGFRRAGIVMLSLLLLLALLPYLVPLSTSGDVTAIRPFDNSRYFESGGTIVHYRIFQPKTGTARGKVLLLHGLGGSTYSFEKTVPALTAQDYLVLAADLPGFGYSGRPESFDHSQRSRGALLWDLLDEVDGTDPNPAKGGWLLVGHSMGGGTAAAMAVQREGDVEHLVLIDGALLENNRGGLLLQIPPVMRWIQVALEHFVIREDRIRSFLRSAYGSEPQEAQVQGYLGPLSLPGTARGAAQLLKTSGNLPLSALSPLKLPVTALWGEEDTWVPLSDTERIRVVLPQLEVVTIAGAGHVPMESHPEAFNDALLRVLKGQASP